MLKATNKVAQCSENLAERGQSRLLEDGGAPPAAESAADQRQVSQGSRRPVYSISRMTQMARVSITHRSLELSFLAAATAAAAVA